MTTGVEREKGREKNDTALNLKGGGGEGRFDLHTADILFSKFFCSYMWERNTSNFFSRAVGKEEDEKCVHVLGVIDPEVADCSFTLLWPKERLRWGSRPFVLLERVEGGKERIYSRKKCGKNTGFKGDDASDLDSSMGEKLLGKTLLPLSPVAVVLSWKIFALWCGGSQGRGLYTLL